MASQIAPASTPGAAAAAAAPVPGPTVRRGELGQASINAADYAPYGDQPYVDAGAARAAAANSSVGGEAAAAAAAVGMAAAPRHAPGSSSSIGTAGPAGNGGEAGGAAAETCCHAAGGDGGAASSSNSSSSKSVVAKGFDATAMVEGAAAAAAATAAAAAQQHGDGQGKPRRRRHLSRNAEELDVERLLSLREPRHDDDAEPSTAGVGAAVGGAQLSARLTAQIQGLNHKQQMLLGIADAPGGARQAYVDRWLQRRLDRGAMVAALRDPRVEPSQRMGVRTGYILKWRKSLFTCPRCWLLPAMCMCDRVTRFSSKTRVLVHVHHSEWGSASNSGCLLPLALEGADMLLYNHPEHDARLHQLLNDPSWTTALLWPGADALLPSELQAMAQERTGGRVAVVALDATWGNARRMRSYFPKGMLTVRLPPETTLRENQLSLLRPVRAYSGDLQSGRVSTLEAVASLLHELEGDDALYHGLLANLKVKVDACRRQKNMSQVYGTQDDSDDDDDAS